VAERAWSDHLGPAPERKGKEGVPSPVVVIKEGGIKTIRYRKSTVQPLEAAERGGRLGTD